MFFLSDVPIMKNSVISTTVKLTINKKKKVQ